MLQHFITGACHQNFAPRFQKTLDPFPGIADQAGAGSRRFKQTCGRGKAEANHTVAMNIEDRERSGVESVVIGGADMIQVHDISRQSFWIPSGPSEHKLELRSMSRDREKELFDSGLAVRQAICQQTEMCGEAVILPVALVSLWIERVVNDFTLTRSQRPIFADHLVATAVCEDQIVSRNERSKRVRRI